MREFERHLARNVISGEKKPIQALKELSSEKILRWYWKVHELSPHACKYFSSHLAPAVSSGEKLSLSETAENLLDGFQVEIYDADQIPLEGPLVVVGNHWKKGPMRGMWEHFLISKAVKDARGEEVRWMIQDALELKIGPIETRRDVPLTSFMSSHFSRAYDLTVVTAPFKIDRAVLNGKQNGQLKLPISTFRTLNKGGVVGFYPEARTSVELVPAWWGSKLLVDRLASQFPEAQVLPVAVRSENRDLLLSFGRSFPIGDVQRTEVAPHDYLMYKIALLLPREFGGYYGRASSG